MNIAVVQSFLPSRSQGGVGHFTHQLANRLVARGHRVTLFSLDPAPSDAAYALVQLQLGRNRFRRIYGFGLLLSQQDYSQFDVIHAMGDNHFLSTGVPVVRTISGSALAEARYARRLTTKILYLSLYPLELLGVCRARVAVGISQHSNEHFPGAHLVIPQGVDLRLFRPSDQKSHLPSIMFVGHRLRDRKRADLLLDTFCRVIRPRLAGAELWLVCDEQVDLPGVRSYSNLSDEQLAALYRRAWVFCLPSSYEGFGRPYAEAMASGTPVVATANPGAVEVLDRGKYGVITDPATLGETLIALLIDGERRACLRAAGLARAAEFSWERVVARYESLYEQLVNRAGTTRQMAS